MASLPRLASRSSFFGQQLSGYRTLPPYPQFQCRYAARVAKAAPSMTTLCEPTNPVKKTRAKSTTAASAAEKPEVPVKRKPGRPRKSEVITSLEGPDESPAKSTKRAASTTSKATKAPKSAKSTAKPDVDESKPVKAKAVRSSRKAVAKEDAQAVVTPAAAIAATTELSTAAATSDSSPFKEGRNQDGDALAEASMNSSNQGFSSNNGSLDSSRTIPVAELNVEQKEASAPSESAPSAQLEDAATDASPIPTASTAAPPSSPELVAADPAIPAQVTSESPSTTKDAPSVATERPLPPPGQPGRTRPISSPRSNIHNPDTGFTFSSGEDPAETPEVRYRRGLEASQQVAQGGKLPPRYKGAARRITAIIVALPFVIVGTPHVWERVVEGKERKKWPTYEGGTFTLEQEGGPQETEVKVVPKFDATEHT